MFKKRSDDQANRSTGAATADTAVEGRPKPHDHEVDAPYAREAEPLADDEKHDQLADKEGCAEDRQEALLDEAIEETFPGSDPISPKHIT